MPVTLDRPPSRVCSAFGADPAALEPVAGEPGWRSGPVVLRPVHDKAEIAWAARTLAAANVAGLRVAVPARATDGRQVVGGWMAYRDPDGVRALESAGARVDDLVLASVKLHQAVADWERPAFLAARTDLWAVADRMAWGEVDPDLDEARGGRWFEVLAGAAKAPTEPCQVVHGNLFRSVRFTEDGTPVVLDFPPYYRPAEWGTALVAVDAVVAGVAGGALLDRWAHLASWGQMLLRAMLFRLAGHALDGASPPENLDALRAAAGVVSEFVQTGSAERRR